MPEPYATSDVRFRSQRRIGGREELVLQVKWILTDGCTEWRDCRTEDLTIMRVRGGIKK